MKQNKVIRGIRNTPKLLGLTVPYFFSFLFCLIAGVMTFASGLSILTFLFALAFIIGAYWLFHKLSNPNLAKRGEDIPIQTLSTTDFYDITRR